MDQKQEKDQLKMPKKKRKKKKGKNALFPGCLRQGPTKYNSWLMSFFAELEN